MEFYSQDGQDKFIVDLFNNKKGGTFIDVGAFDGVTFSNSYFLEKNNEWKGICIEPNPVVFENLKINRKCVCINCCIGGQIGVSEFLAVSGSGKMLSGLLNTLDEKHLLRIDKEIEKGHATKSVLNLQVMPLKDILKEHNITYVDYCNIDVEGGELSVLKSIDFSKVTIKVFTIENNYNDNSVSHFLKTYKYRLIGKVGADEVYELKSKRYSNMIFLKIKKIKNVLSSLKHKIIRTKI